MCGIFGVIAREGILSFENIEDISKKLFLLSESRGKESAGLAVATNGTVSVFKSPQPASVMTRSPHYKNFLRELLQTGGFSGKQLLHHPIALIGHSRLVTNGSQENHDNNQPVIKDGIAAVHNGIIVNDDHLWAEFPQMQRLYQVDTEVILGLIRHFYKGHASLSNAVSSTYSLLVGTASMAMLFNDLDNMVLTTNDGSLYICTNNDRSVLIFASEEYILRQLLRIPLSQRLFGQVSIQQIKPGYGLLVDTLTLHTEEFSLTKSSDLPRNILPKIQSLPIRDFTPPEVMNSGVSTLFEIPTVIPESIYKKFIIKEQPIRDLKRCTRCILPETMPFIEFDEDGVCNYCRTYQKQALLGAGELQQFADKYRSKNGKPDCIVTFSGGRDSSYCLHYVKTVLKMNPVAYTYDWGMVTDLGRRNQARLCGKLGVEHILVSADIRQKRENIRKNVTAWLKRPDLGTVPLFMAGDKQYFYYANKLKEQTGVQITILGENLLETTNFKSGFCGIRPSIGLDHTYTLSVFNKARLAVYYGKQYLLNPAYINRSLIDTMGAFASYYIIPHNHVNLFDYIMWDEEKIVPAIIQEYDWEVAADTRSTWRIGDGTAAFYNYIYYLGAGFTENDTFRSNQIREGTTSREKAMSLISEDNHTRFESIQWYCNTIGIDFVNTLECINKMPKLYEA